MSHFSVLVIGDNPEEKLAPFHEFESTGRDDKYVQDIDITEEALKEYNSRTVTMVEVPDVGLVKDTDDMFFREPTPEESNDMIGSTGIRNGKYYKAKDWEDGKGYRPKVHEIPEGSTLVEVPENQAFPEFVEYYYGYTLGKSMYGYVEQLPDGSYRVIKRTNPNAKWDWYCLGGRWSNMLRMKPTSLLPSPEMFDKFGFSQAAFMNLVQLYRKDKDKFKALISKYKGKSEDIESTVQIYCTPVFQKEIRGQKGVLGMQHSEDAPGRCDQCAIGQLDIEQMEAEAVLKAEETWVEVQNIINEFGIPPRFKDVVDRNNGDVEAARDIYKEIPAVIAFKKANMGPIFGDIVDTYFLDKEDPHKEYIEKARCSAFSTFAVITEDGKWHERGEMGWFGMSHNEKEDYDWDAQFKACIEGLDGNTLISIYDCHI